MISSVWLEKHNDSDILLLNVHELFYEHIGQAKKRNQSNYVVIYKRQLRQILSTYTRNIYSIIELDYVEETPEAYPVVDSELIRSHSSRHKFFVVVEQVNQEVHKQQLSLLQVQSYSVADHDKNERSFDYYMMTCRGVFTTQSWRQVLDLDARVDEGKKSLTIAMLCDKLNSTSKVVRVPLSKDLERKISL